MDVDGDTEDDGDELMLVEGEEDTELEIDVLIELDGEVEILLEIDEDSDVEIDDDGDEDIEVEGLTLEDIDEDIEVEGLTLEEGDVEIELDIEEDGELDIDEEIEVDGEDEMLLEIDDDGEEEILLEGEEEIDELIELIGAGAKDAMSWSHESFAVLVTCKDVDPAGVIAPFESYNPVAVLFGPCFLRVVPVPAELVPALPFLFINIVQQLLATVVTEIVRLFTAAPLFVAEASG
jgi:hypothetical protein